MNAELSVVIPLWSRGDNLERLLPAIDTTLGVPASGAVAKPVGTPDAPPARTVASEG